MSYKQNPSKHWKHYWYKYVFLVEIHRLANFFTKALTLSMTWNKIPTAMLVDAKKLFTSQSRVGCVAIALFIPGNWRKFVDATAHCVWAPEHWPSLFLDIMSVSGKANFTFRIPVLRSFPNTLLRTTKSEKQGALEAWKIEWNGCILC